MFLIIVCHPDVMLAGLWFSGALGLSRKDAREEKPPRLKGQSWQLPVVLLHFLVFQLHTVIPKID